MKNFHFPLLFLLLLSSCVQKQKPELKNQTSKNQLPIALDAFNHAFASGDLDLLDALTTENYVHTNGDSKAITKNDWFNYLQKRNQQLASGDIEILKYTLDEQKITYHGPMAIVTGKVSVVSKDSLGTKEHQYRVTNVWVVDSGQWKRAGFHDGKIQ